MGKRSDDHAISRGRRVHSNRAGRHHQESMAAADPVPVRALRHQLPRPHQYRFRRTVDEQGSGADRDHVRPRQFDLLYRLCRLRDPQQPLDGALRRPDLDRAHPGFMGAGVRRHHAGGRPQQPVSGPLPGRGARGRLRARRALVSDLLDSEFAPRPRQWLFDDGAAGGDGAWRRRVGPDPGSL